VGSERSFGRSPGRRHILYVVLDDQPARNGILWRLNDLTRRVQKIEDLKPEILAYEVAELRKDVIAMKRAFYTFAFSVVTGSILFAFTVFALLGKHPA
jgi:hypothetical protein